jgi:hypothetical protein
MVLIRFEREKPINYISLVGSLLLEQFTTFLILLAVSHALAYVQRGFQS